MPPNRPRRSQRETQEIPRGIGGLPPHPAPGPVTALRVLGHGFEIPIDAETSKNVRGAGFEFVYEGLQVLAIDETTRQLIAPLTSFWGRDANSDIDATLVALLWPHAKRPIVLRGPRSERIADLARLIHEHATRKHFPFTEVTTVPTSDAAVGALCTQGGCGTLFLDLTPPPWCFRQPWFVTCFRIRHMRITTTLVRLRLRRRSTMPGGVSPAATSGPPPRSGSRRRASVPQSSRSTDEGCRPGRPGVREAAGTCACGKYRVHAATAVVVSLRLRNRGHREGLVAAYGPYPVLRLPARRASS